MEPFVTGETVQEQFAVAVELETRAIDQLHSAIRIAEHDGDDGTAVMLREMVVEEENQLSWLETQVLLIERLGEAQYLSLQVRA